MASEPVGRIKCTLCGDENAVTEQKTGFVMYNCQWCGAQHFARSKHSDGKMRSLMIPGSAPVAAPSEPKPKPVEEAPPKASEPAPAPKPAAKKPATPVKKSVFGF